MNLALSILEFLGAIAIYFIKAISYLIKGKVNIRLTFHQMDLLAVSTIPLAILVLGFVGATVTYMLVEELAKRGLSAHIGGFLLVALLRELVPVLTGVVLAGKAGAAITSELGAMKITEQIDALRALSVEPHWYLTTPRVLGLTLMAPIVATFAAVSGFYAGFLLAHFKIGMTYVLFTSSLREWVVVQDFTGCFIKSLVFGAVVALVGCYQGFQVEGGAQALGKAVTFSVVISIVLIFALDLALLPILF